MSFIDKHNKQAAAGQYTFTVGINEFADLTTQEFKKFFNGLNMNISMSTRDSETETYPQVLEDLPASVDWRTKV